MDELELSNILAKCRQGIRIWNVFGLDKSFNFPEMLNFKDVSFDFNLGEDGSVLYEYKKKKNEIVIQNINSERIPFSSVPTRQ